MDRGAARTQWSLSTQSTYEDDGDTVDETTNGDVDHVLAPSGEKENETKVETKLANNNNLPRSRSKSNLKLLKRSHAIKESTSPPPDIPLSPIATSPTCELPTTPSSNNNNNPSTMNNNGLNLRPTIKREGSNQSSDSNWSSSLSRGNSMEQQNNEQPPLNLEQFLSDTLNGSTKDRIFLLRIENDLISFIKDSRKTTHKFGMMSSYQRMLVHRVAHYYGMDHNVDASGHMVVVTKGKSTKMPHNRLTCFIRDDVPLSEEPRKSILKRDSASFEDTVSFKSPDRHNVDQPRRSKSFEEREEEYEKARARIFHEQGDSCSQDGEEELRWSQLSASWERTESSDSTKLHPNSHRPSRLTKVESYESRDTLRANSLRSSVSKSYSFGGYDQSSNNRVLTKQDSGSSVSSRVSPSSSGYKSQSQRSDTTLSATPSPSATPHLTTQLSNQSGAFSPDIEHETGTVLWAVTNMASVPAGSVLINPLTGQPVKNEDGSVYHFDPDHPPQIDNNPEVIISPRQNCENGRNLEGMSGRMNQNEPSGASEPAAPNNDAAPAQHPPAPSYHHAEQPSHAEPEAPPNGIMNAPQMPYPQMPPPTAHTMPAPASTYPAMTYNPPAAPYNAGMQPPPVEGYAPAPTSTPHFVYGVPLVPGLYSSTIVPGPSASYDRAMNPAMVNQEQELCNYFMGVSINETPANRPDVPQRVYFCPQPSPLSQTYQCSFNTLNECACCEYCMQPGSAVGAPPVPVYFAPHTPAPPPQPTPHQPRYPPCAYQYPQQPERTAPECSYPPSGVHAYFSRCPSTPQVGGTPANYCAPSGPSTGAGITMGVTMMPPTHSQTPRPYHRLPTPPNTPQNGCTQFPIYGGSYPIPGCYQHFQAANPPTQIPLTPMMRPTQLLSVGNSPPVRPQMRAPAYNGAAARSPVVRDSAPSEPSRHSSSPLRYSAAITPTAPTPHYVYRWSFPAQYANEFYLMNNNRAPFTSPPAANRIPPSVPFSNLRRNRRQRGQYIHSWRYYNSSYPRPRTPRFRNHRTSGSRSPISPGQRYSGPQGQNLRDLDSCR